MSDLCDDALGNLYPFLDRELDDTAYGHVRAHLADCPPCGDAVSFEERLRVVVRSRLQEEVPQVVIERLRVVLRSERRFGG